MGCGLCLHPFPYMKYISKIFFIFLALFCIGTGLGLIIQTGLPSRADYTGTTISNIGYVAPEINHIAPPFTLATLDFENLSLRDLQGEMVIINFWATWCVPCRIEMPELQHLYERYSSDIRILGINLGESPQAVAQWVSEFDLTYDILLDPLQSTAQQYQIRGQPSTYVLDVNGVIHALYYGPVSMEQLEQDITHLQNID